MITEIVISHVLSYIYIMFNITVISRVSGSPGARGLGSLSRGDAVRAS